MRTLLNVFFILLIIFFPLIAQNTLGDDFSIELTIFDNQKLQSLYLSDLDFQNFGSGEEVFTITITKNTDLAYQNCLLHLQLKKENEILIDAISQPFNIPGGNKGEEFTVSNLTLAEGGLRFGDTEDTEVYFDQINIKPEAESLKEQILASGKVPVGIYWLTIELRQAQQATPLAALTTVLLKATNPSYLNLVSPGNPASSGQVPSIYTQYPLFQWTGNGSEYQVMVFEKKEMMQSFDDIINSQANWKSERTSQFSIQYPQAGNAIPLEYGKTYYWLVRMFTQTSSGEEFLDSEIWQFQVSNPERGSNLQEEFAQNELWQFLVQLLGERADEVKENLKGASLKRIIYNGEEISISQFFQILNGYRGQQFELLEFEAPTH